MPKKSGWRERLARWIAPKRPKGVRLYAGARHTRTTGSFGASAGSADAELSASLTVLRQRSRQMVRDSAYAKRAKAIIVNNVIGTGVGMQAQVETTRGTANSTVNDAIESAWKEWAEADQCHTGGVLAFGDLERALQGEVFEAGEVFVRLHRRPFGRSRIPFALEMIEAERIADGIESYGIAPGNELRMGVEVDQFGRPAAYWIRGRNQGDIRVRVGESTDRVERVPASEIIHLKITTRWPQTRGEPWMHAVLRKVDDLDQYSQHEITAARASAAYFATITTPEPDNGLKDDEEEDTGKQVMDIEPLTIQSLMPGETLDFHTPNRPNSAFDAFVRAMLREIAAGVGTSYESLSRDYSQSNYSSSRLSLLDDRDGYRSLQQWWLRSFRLPLHRIWLQQAVLSGAIREIPIEAYGRDMKRYEAVTFKPRGWSWVDPTKEVTAYKEAIRAGLTTITDVISQTAGGLDIEDVIKTRKRELEMLEEADIEVDTTVQEEPEAPAAPAAPIQDAPASDTEDAEDDMAASDSADAARVLQMRKTA